MRELDAIIEAYTKAAANNTPCVLATVVHVKGSSYRAAGARMLVDEFGNMTGAISGGCLEGDALRKALLALEQQQNKLITYDTSDEDDAVIGAQLGCNGIIQVLFEPIDPARESHALHLLEQAAHHPDPIAAITLFNLDNFAPQLGTRLVVDAGTITAGTLEDDELQQKLCAAAAQAQAEQQLRFVSYEHDATQMQAFIDVIEPPPHLVLIGAGNDAQIIATMGRHLGWQVTVADGRPSHANEQRFQSCQVIVSDPGAALEPIRITERTVFVLITHNYNYDMGVLKQLLDEPATPYIGILGPNKKYKRMLDDLEAEGIELTEAHHQKIYAPVGLQLGAETPAEIALSILSEIQAVLSGAEVQHLRSLEGTIHDKSHRAFKSLSS